MRAAPSPVRGGRRSRAYPNLFLVGVAKGGTTTLWHALDRHPEIWMSQAKEPNYFTSHRVEGVDDEQAYLALFARGASAKLRGEASPLYFSDESAPAAIRKASPDAKILVSLRDPVARAESHYWHSRRLGRETRTFRAAVDAELAAEPGSVPLRLAYVRRGFYADALRRYIDVFGDRMHVLFFEELVADPEGVLRRMFGFLGVDPGPAARGLAHANPFGLPRGPITARVYRSARAPRFARAVTPARLRPRIERLLLSGARRPPSDSDLLDRLRSLYERDRREVEDVLGRSVPW